MAQITLKITLPPYPVGTRFVYQYGKQKYNAVVVGYHVEHNTETGVTNVQYRAQYPFITQLMTVTVARSTVARALIKEEQSVAN